MLRTEIDDPTALMDSVLEGMTGNNVIVGPVQLIQSQIFREELLMFRILIKATGGGEVRELMGKTEKDTRRLRKWALEEMTRRRLNIADCAEEEAVEACIRVLWPELARTVK
jgi:hypothetical protein